MSVFLCDNKPSTIAPGTSAEGDPQSTGAAERSRNVTKGHVRSIKPAVGSASGVDVPADRKKSVWEGAPLFSLRSLVNKSGEYPLDSRFEQGRYFWDQWRERTQSLLSLQVVLREAEQSHHQ